ncbi:hypothetical protein MJH12_01295 [bacterium]|nr:hypothetical protein [bacterium]
MKFIYNTNDQIDGIDSKKCIFVDGTSSLIDAKKDLELSHWIPNNTEEIYKAGTSTQICLNYVRVNSVKEHDWVINNHVDVDGILSAFVIMDPNLALKNAEVLSQASMMGDFSFCGDKKATHFYINLGECIKKWQKKKIVHQEIFEKGFLMIQNYFLKEDYPFDDFANQGIQDLDLSIDLVKQNKIVREEHNELFSSYLISHDLRCAIDKNCIYQAGFDFGLDLKQILPMQVLNHFDFERQKLLIMEDQEGFYFYDLLLPDYLWAETKGLYRTKGVHSTESTNVHLFDHPGLQKAQSLLNELEKKEGSWNLATNFHPFASIKGRGFPIVLSFMKDDKVQSSSLDPKFVMNALKDIWE